MKKRMTALVLTLVFVAAVLAGCAVAAAERDSDSKKEIVATVTETPATEAPAKENLLDADAAQVIALAHAGVAAADAAELHSEYEVDDGVKEYEIEFRSGDYEYDYTVNAETGKIISGSKEHDPVETKPAATEAPTEAPAEAAPAETEAKKEESSAKDTASSTKATTSSSKSSSDLIGKSKAKSIALDHAGLSSSKVTNLRCEYEVDDGVKEYEVDFRSGDYEYEYTIHAVTGKIRAHDKEYDPVETKPAATEPKATEASSSDLIGKSKAKSIALDHAGLSASKVTNLRCEYEVDDGVKEYEVDFRSGDYEYEYTIHAVTGKIRAHDKEYDPVETKPVATEPKATEASSSDLIGKSKAKSIALDHAGLSSSKVTNLRCEYEVDDGVKEYEVDFRSGDYEYEYTINAVTGKIVSHDKEYDPEETVPAATEAPAEEKIGKSKAKSIALNHAGFSADEVKEMECEYDGDDGVKKYEVSFRKGSYEYDYEINAVTGKIISWDKEYDD